MLFNWLTISHCNKHNIHLTFCTCNITQWWCEFQLILQLNSVVWIKNALWFRESLFDHQTFIILGPEDFLNCNLNTVTKFDLWSYNKSLWHLKINSLKMRASWIFFRPWNFILFDPGRYHALMNSQLAQSIKFIWMSL